MLAAAPAGSWSAKNIGGRGTGRGRGAGGVGVKIVMVYLPTLVRQGLIILSCLFFFVAVCRPMLGGPAEEEAEEVLRATDSRK